MRWGGYAQAKGVSVENLIKGGLKAPDLLVDLRARPVSVENLIKGGLKDGGRWSGRCWRSVSVENLIKGGLKGLRSSVLVRPEYGFS